MIEGAASPGVPNATGTRVVIRSLTVRAGQRELLRDASAQFESGNVTLIVGRSGVGKSTLLRIIAGLVDGTTDGLAISGQVELVPTDGDLPGHDPSVGVVFQDFALFDELSPKENVRFARDHRSRQRDVTDDTLEPDDLLQELGVPAATRTAALSGGQRQRLAVARALAYAPDVLLYDEPTSGLDAATAAEVAELIAATHGHHPRTSIIVTHDYEALASIADVIYRIAPERGALIEVDRKDWPTLAAQLAQRAPTDVEDLPGPSRSGISGCRTWVLAEAAEFFTATSRALEAAAEVPMRLVPRWKSPAWGGRFFLHYLHAVAGPSAWLYLAIAGAIVGFVSTYFTLRFLPYANYTEPLLIEELLGSIGFALYRIFVPILATILIAARCGAAVASDVGGKRYGRQFEALQTLGAAPKDYLQTNILYAFLLGTPLLVAIAYVVASMASLIVFTATHPERGPWFWQLHFHQALIVPGQFSYAGTGWLLAKTLLCGIGIAVIAYRRGASPKGSSRAVSEGVTSTILWATLFVLGVHFLFAFMEFE